MLSKKSKYALKAMMVLAKEYGQGPVLISDMARRESITHKFLELILLEELVRNTFAPRHIGYEHRSLAVFLGQNHHRL